MEFSPRRCRDSRKPALSEIPKMSFYRCEKCGELYSFLEKEGEPDQKRRLICCGEAILPLEEKEDREGRLFSYEITGGYNNNAVECTWHGKEYPEWIILQTFQGYSYKEVRKGKKTIFSLADLDAFSYCDESPCLECTFRCKRGFTLYFYGAEIGLYSCPLDKFSPYWDKKTDS